MNAGAVVLTDCIYWSIIFPFLAIKDYDVNFVSTADFTGNMSPLPYFLSQAEDVNLLECDNLK